MLKRDTILLNIEIFPTLFLTGGLLVYELMRHRWASLISGGGTTMAAIIQAMQSGEIAMDVACIISSSPTAGGIAKAKKLGIAAKDIIIVNPEDYRDEKGKVDQEKFGKQIIAELKKRKVTVITQNGWLPLTPKNVINEYTSSIFNQHPGPVPEFGGKGMFGRRVHAARLLFVRMTNRDYWTEVIAQRVHAEFDRGEVVKSIRVPIRELDTVDDLQRRALREEYQVQIDLLKDFIKGTLQAIKRTQLVKPEEKEILIRAKEMAILLYPEG